jgi:hypothetical protein
MRAEKERARLEREASWRAEQTALLSEFKAAGWSVESVWDLVGTSTPYPELIPILLRHLSLPYSDRTKEGIARSLAVPDSKNGWSQLVAEYCKADVGPDTKDGLAAALAAVSSDDVIGELADLAKDTSNGSSHVLLLGGLKKSKSPVAKSTIAELSNDPQLMKEIASWGDVKNK